MRLPAAFFCKLIQSPSVEWKTHCILNRNQIQVWKFFSVSCNWTNQWWNRWSLQKDTKPKSLRDGLYCADPLGCFLQLEFPKEPLKDYLQRKIAELNLQTPYARFDAGRKYGLLMFVRETTKLLILAQARVVCLLPPCAILTSHLSHED